MMGLRLTWRTAAIGAEGGEIIPQPSPMPTATFGSQRSTSDRLAQIHNTPPIRTAAAREPFSSTGARAGGEFQRERTKKAAAGDGNDAACPLAEGQSPAPHRQAASRKRFLVARGS